MGNDKEQVGVDAGNYDDASMHDECQSSRGSDSRLKLPKTQTAAQVKNQFESLQERLERALPLRGPDFDPEHDIEDWSDEDDSSDYEDSDDDFFNSRRGPSDEEILA